MLAQQHLLVVWSAVFFLIEHYNDEISDPEFKPNVLKVCTSFTIAVSTFYLFTCLLCTVYGAREHIGPW